ncbi:hypothetical protein NP493_2g14008 [Ridgeia piscesae]|uniref:Secreted protein n=1 Tax=Ridgeia piscesae TaxID=27915 RepID=A0AAD9PG55_RIDPI|nr:hypothetical protein NP493_2g14008 [Ridgeia piscesae]
MQTSFINVYFLISRLYYLWLWPLSPSSRVTVVVPHLSRLLLLWFHKSSDRFCCGAGLSRLAVVPCLALSLVDIVAPAHRLCTDCFLRCCNRSPVHLDVFVAVVTLS